VRANAEVETKAMKKQDTKIISDEELEMDRWENEGGLGQICQAGYLSFTVTSKSTGLVTG
jgi:hypothetical protein